MDNVFSRIAAVLALLLFLSIIMWAVDADMRLAYLVYDEQTRWPGLGRFPWNFIYDYAAVPGFVLAGLALIVLVAGFVKRSLVTYRHQSLFLILLLVLGPGLVVNVLLKDNLGRARPRELVEFGGKYEFSQIWETGETGKNSSFPSGHSSAGFYMIAPWFLLRRHRRTQGYAWLIGGAGYGLLVGVTRILQGGHFLSDVLWAGGIVYITGELLAWKLVPNKPEPS